jgi:histidinol-phosphatase
MTVAELEGDLDLALELADAADALTMAAFTGEAIAFEDKDDGTPVTAHDRLVEEKLRAVLAARRPADGFLGEETGASSATENRRWILDPIDGTVSFARGGRNWATQIALEVDGELVLGVTSAPVVDARWWGAAGVGAFRRTTHDAGPQPLAVGTAADLAGATWISYPRIDRLSDDWRQLPERLAAACEAVKPTSHGALMVAGGEVDVCLQLGGAPWDYAAFAALVRVAGGSFSYLDGTTALTGNRPAVFSNGRIHAAVLDLLRT